jgi:hypothetical protein
MHPDDHEDHDIDHDEESNLPKSQAEAESPSESSNRTLMLIFAIGGSFATILLLAHFMVSINYVEPGPRQTSILYVPGPVRTVTVTAPAPTAEKQPENSMDEDEPEETEQPQVTPPSPPVPPVPTPDSNGNFTGSIHALYYTMLKFYDPKQYLCDTTKRKWKLTILTCGIPRPGPEGYLCALSHKSLVTSYVRGFRKLGIEHNINPSSDAEVHEVVWIPDTSGEVYEQNQVLTAARRLQASVCVVVVVVVWVEVLILFFLSLFVCRAKSSF